MRYKVLTVDDSKTVRLIVKKAFKAYDVEIFEAANGVEGLAVAARESPDLILLDITMPVMDGVEMLTRLKADPLLQGMSVIMLTAEGGRDNVLKIAKIGICDYIVKPFNEGMLIGKCSRVIDLKLRHDIPAQPKPIFDPAAILAVEDPPAIEPPPPQAQTVDFRRLVTKPNGMGDAATRIAHGMNLGKRVGS